MAEEPDLEFLARQMDRVLIEVGSMREDMRVMMTILMRHDVAFEKYDANSTALLREIRALHSQISRMNDRIRKVEDQDVR